MAGLSDFGALLAADPHGFGNAWGDIQKQLQSEGASQTDIVGAQTALASAFSQLSSQMGVNGAQALDAAKQYVIAGNTVIGAAQNVAGLIQSANSMPPTQLISTFTGTLIGGAVALGAISAGVGAAIVGAVDGLLALLQGAGLFGSPPSGTEVCPGFYCDGPAFTVTTQGPAGVIGCCCVSQLGNNPARVVTASPLWRSFPDASNQDDLVWLIASKALTVKWRQAIYAVPMGFLPGDRNGVPVVAAVRPIDWAFPQYRTMECNAAQLTQDDPLYWFQRAFFSAWKLNAAYALNGLKAVDDAQVLLHTLRLWNRAHTASSTATIQPASGALVAPNETCMPGDAARPLYIGMLASGASGSVSAEDASLISPDGGLIVHTGPGKSVTLKSGTGVSMGGYVGKTTPAPSSVSATSKALIATGAVAAVAAGSAAAYGVLAGEGPGFLFKRAIESASGAFEEATVAAEAPGRASMQVQSLLFSRSRYSTSSAKAWAKSHGYRYGKVDVTDRYIRLRQRSPRGLRVERTVTFGHGIRAVVGR